MQDLIHMLSTANAEHMESIINAAMNRYRELFPDWEIVMFSLERNGNREEQIDQMIRLLQKLKTEE